MAKCPPDPPEIELRELLNTLRPEHFPIRVIMFGTDTVIQSMFSLSVFDPKAKVQLIGTALGDPN